MNQDHVTPKRVLIASFFLGVDERWTPAAMRAVADLRRAARDIGGVMVESTEPDGRAYRHRLEVHGPEGTEVELVSDGLAELSAARLAGQQQGRMYRDLAQVRQSALAQQGSGQLWGFGGGLGGLGLGLGLGSIFDRWG